MARANPNYVKFRVLISRIHFLGLPPLVQLSGILGIDLLVIFPAELR